MPYAQSVIDLIHKRTSIRSYRPDLIEEDTVNQLNNFINTLKTGPFGSKARFKFVFSTDDKNTELRKLGTYGFIKGATGYIISALKDEDKNLEDLGYQMEEVILYATELGLGTCWLGGTFTKSSFAAKMDLLPGEIIPAVTATGLPAEDRSGTEKLIRKGASAHLRFPWEKLFFKDAFGNPLSESSSGDFATPLEMLRLAPSASNRQPWRIVTEQGNFHLFLERSPGYRSRRANRWFTNADMQRIDMGIAMCHFELSAKEIGLPGKWTVQTPIVDLPEGEISYVASWIP